MNINVYLSFIAGNKVEVGPLAVAVEYAYCREVKIWGMWNTSSLPYFIGLL